MTAFSARSLTHPATPRNGVSIPASVRWPAGVVLLLSMSVVIQSVAVFLASGDPSFAVEENYEAKAMNYNDVIAQRQENLRLGWRATVLTTPPNRSLGPVSVDVLITDADDLPILGALVRFDARHVARAAQIVRAAPTERDDGHYQVDLPITRTGIWEFRVTAERGADVFTATVRQDVLAKEVTAR